VVNNVIVSERLLDHHQVKLVQALEAIRILERIRGVRIRHERRARKAAADLPNHIHIPARFDFDLDALVSRGHLGLDFRQELRDRVLDPD